MKCRYGMILSLAPRVYVGTTIAGIMSGPRRISSWAPWIGYVGNYPLSYPYFSMVQGTKEGLNSQKACAWWTI